MELKQNPLYIQAWNQMVKELAYPNTSLRAIKTETFRYIAHKALLNSEKQEMAQAILDCTSEYQETGKVPKGR